VCGRSSVGVAIVKKGTLQLMGLAMAYAHVHAALEQAHKHIIRSLQQVGFLTKYAL
jgi:hypothetical protein